MNKKNIIIFSLATTLLFANCTVGMEKKEKAVIGYGKKTRKQVLKNLNQSKNKIISVTCSKGITTKNLNALINACIKKNHIIRHLFLEECDVLAISKINFHLLTNNLETLDLSNQDVTGVDLGTIVENNKKTLRLLTLRRCKGIGWKDLYELGAKYSEICVVSH